MKTCTVEGCDNRYLAKGLCQKHYLRKWRYGDVSITKLERHGMENIPENKVWKHMKERCYNPNNTSYKYYGGRGITVCGRWLHSFSTFYEDMGPRPTKNHQIDRKENDGNYEPDNCRWATHIEQARNKRNTVMCIDYARKIKDLIASKLFTYIEIAAIYKVKPYIIHNIAYKRCWKDV